MSATEVTRIELIGFSGQAITPGDEKYEAARAVWNGTVTSRPAVIARCHSEGDVVSAVRASGEAPLAVRGGSHSLPGFCSCDGGIVVDLSAMRSVSVDVDRRIATVGGGATWADFDAATAVHGLAATGGLISTTGVGGLTLGGGIGWLQRKYGLACDNLRAARVVTADGDVVDADDALLWGLRGGGGNFGVVTQFEFDLHRVSTVVGGLLLFPFDRAGDVLHAFGEWTADAPDEASLLFAINCAPPAPFVPPEFVGQKVAAVAGCWCGDVPAADAALAPLRALGPIADVFGPMPYPALQSMLDESAPYGLRNYFRGGYLGELTDDVVGAVLEHGARFSSPLSQIHLHQMGGAVDRYGADTSSFSGRGAAFTYNLVGTWIDPGKDGRYVAEVRAAGAALAPMSLSGGYVNFDTELPAAERTRTAYGDEIYDRLARLKREYDPANRFRYNQNVRPAP